MHKFQSFIAVASAFSIAALFACTDSASAQAKKKKQYTYEEAWKRCQTEVNKLPGDQVAQRHARGASCMKRLGHNI